MRDLAPLYQQFDPLRPLLADEADRYVDWQRQLYGNADIKHRLTNSISRGGNQALTRLFTGHRGVGKTTELYRVKRILETGSLGHRKFFVSMLLAEQWVNLNDVQPEDLVFQIVRQLVTDLRKQGFEAPANAFTSFFTSMRSKLALESIDLGPDPLRLSFSLQGLPSARDQLRRLLQERLPSIYDLVNNEILTAARTWLADPGNGGYDDVLIIIDQLDRMPQKVLRPGLTNHENLFLDNAPTLRSLDCDLLYTVPIELAYSHAQGLLSIEYGTQTLGLPVIAIVDRNGGDQPHEFHALRQIVERRAASVGISLDEVFDEGSLLDTVLRASGGHVRSLFVIIRSMLDVVDDIPISASVVIQSLRRAATSAARPLGRRDWQILDEVHETKQPPGDDDAEHWYRLLRDLYALAYEDDDGPWYDRNPLLDLVGARSRPVLP